MTRIHSSTPNLFMKRMRVSSTTLNPFMREQTYLHAATVSSQLLTFATDSLSFSSSSNIIIISHDESGYSFYCYLMYSISLYGFQYDRAVMEGEMTRAQEIFLSLTMASRITNSRSTRLRPFSPLSIAPIAPFDQSFAQTLHNLFNLLK